MKKLAYFLLVFSLFSFTHQSQHELTWYHWNEGFAKAHIEGKIALIDVYTDWCGWCKRMDKDTYEKEAIISKIEANFVPIKFNPEKHNNLIVGTDTLSGRELLGALSRGNHSGYPTTYFYIPQKNHMMQIGGYQNEQKFAEILDNVLKVASEPAPQSTN
ncbi:MAG: DUF255 domain-containing protein [Flavobacteriales bacterium]|nr:DUF255 domain-containing protein [Flavobacteriales bacterium]